MDKKQSKVRQSVSNQEESKTRKKEKNSPNDPEMASCSGDGDLWWCGVELSGDSRRQTLSSVSFVWRKPNPPCTWLVLAGISPQGGEKTMKFEGLDLLYIFDK